MKYLRYQADAPTEAARSSELTGNATKALEENMDFIASLPSYIIPFLVVLTILVARMFGIDFALILDGLRVLVARA